MKKTILITICILSLISCKENKSDQTENKQSENVSLADAIKSSSLKKGKLTKEEIEKKKKEVNHLFVANGGSILYMKNGDVKGAARFDTDGDFVGELLQTKTYGKYKDYDNYVIGDQGDTLAFFDENGRVGMDWKILKGVDINNELQVVSFTSPKKEVPNETEIVTTTKLVIFSPETKSFKDENSVEAENYFAAMDDWSYYSNELSKYFEELGVKPFYSKKRYLTFEIENGKKITIDTKKQINNFNVQCLLYRKGKRPIIVYLLPNDNDKEEIQRYLD
ncbi:hypothetical protein [Flavobacterium aestivum]|uniref:hypothetical protein n=1 Tax=Flavobacterium aestivum TaxID=3003257 RepID=UPI002286C800|nr:hypothetical protein [Flavobacterium aestivum]